MPRSMSYRSRILAALQAGPLTLRDAYAMASDKRSAISRLSEMRAAGEITDALILVQPQATGLNSIKQHTNPATEPG